MKRILSTVVFVIGILGIISAISYYGLVQPWTNECFASDSIFIFYYFQLFVRYFLNAVPYLGIVLFIFAEKDKKSILGFIFILLTIVPFQLSTVFATSCF